MLVNPLCSPIKQDVWFYEEKEIVDENPFLSDFYDDIEKWSFQTEMFFYVTDINRLEILSR